MLRKVKFLKYLLLLIVAGSFFGCGDISVSDNIYHGDIRISFPDNLSRSKFFDDNSQLTGNIVILKDQILVYEYQSQNIRANSTLSIRNLPPGTGYQITLRIFLNSELIYIGRNSDFEIIEDEVTYLTLYIYEVN